jgi:hypothetical protein
VVGVGYDSVNIAGRTLPIEINRYVVSKGDDRAVVLYWYQSRDRVVASEYQSRGFYRLGCAAI